MACGALPHRQHGLALVLLLGLLLLVSSAILLDRLNSQASASSSRDVATAQALGAAKAALMAWSTTYQAGTQRQTGPGTLPYPDRSGIDGNYDGMADCDALVASDVVLLGRLPWAGELDDPADPADDCQATTSLFVDLLDGSKEPLWYAVSRNLLAGGGGGPINPGIGEPGRATYPWIQLRDSQGNVINDPNTGNPLVVAAVIIAPGAVVGNQNRTGAAPAPANYLDSISIAATTYDNADADGCPVNLPGPCVGLELEEFVVYSDPQSTASFNDKLAYITVGELMRAVEKRVLGEAEQFLDDYRAANGSYPWLADFRDPRGPQGNDSNAAISTTVMDDNDAAPPANFVAAGVRVGDTIVNLTTGGRGYITDVAATSITFNALEGGSDAEFEFGDDYVIEATFTSDMARNGLIPVSQRLGEIFKTGFTVKWNFSHIHELDDDSGGAASALVPITDTRDVLSYLVMSEDGIVPAPVVIGPDEGYCRWTTESRVDCYGKTVGPFVRLDLPGPPTVQRTIEVNIAFDASGTDPGDPAPFVSLPAVVVNPPTATSPRTRDLSVSSEFLATTIPPPLGGLAPELTLTAGGIIKTTDELLGDWGSQELTMLKGVGGADHGEGVITVTGIRYESSVNFDDIDAGDDIPEWFVENDWHHYIYVAFAADVVAGGDNDCTLPDLPTPPTCLTLNVAGNPVPREIQGLVISSGVPLPTQDRTIGDCDGDGDGQIDDPTNDSFLCAYFDSDNTALYDVSAEKLRHGANTLSIRSAPADDNYARDNYSNSFNDQIRIIDLAPP